MQDNELFMSFNYSDNEVSTSKAIQGEHSWMKHLQEFVLFLESTGYVGVRERVAIDTTAMCTENIDWTGLTFTNIQHEN